MTLQRIEAPLARIVHSNQEYAALVDAWGLPNVPLANLILNRVATPIDRAHPAFQNKYPRDQLIRGFQWNEQDNDSQRWVPQGLTGTGDAHANGRHEARKMLAATWHFRDDSRTRITFVDLTDAEAIRYRHVLLVEPIRVGGLLSTYRDIQNHAGGVVWYGNKLYVVDTHGGLRVFDVGCIKRVATGDTELVGRQRNGQFHAHDFLYILPQIARYRPLPPFVHRWSFSGLDRSALPHALVSGEYDPDAPSRLYWWPLEQDGLLASQRGFVQAAFGCKVTDTHLQGVHSLRGPGDRTTVWLSSTDGRKEALLKRVADHGELDNRFEWPDKPEGLTYFADGDELWTASEKLHNRIVFAVQRAGL